jgi:hypothetical protein
MQALDSISGRQIRLDELLKQFLQGPVEGRRSARE